MKLLLSKLTQNTSIYLAYVSAWLVVFTMAIVVYEVWMRFVVQVPVGWAVELPRLVFLVIIFLGLAYAARTGAHVSLDIITLHLSKRPLGLLTAITSLLALFVSVVLAWQSIRIISDAFREKWATATVPTVIEWPFYTAMVLGSFVMCLEWIAKIVGGWRDFRHPPEPEPERNA